MLILFLDTETTGLPTKRQDAIIESNVWPDIVSVAWVLTDEAGRILRTFYTIVKPDGWTITPDSTRIHGISHEVAEKSGMNFTLVMDTLQAMLGIADRVVCHNVHFDSNVIMNAFHWRMCRPVGYKDCFKDTYCTMEMGKKVGHKFPKLAQLYQDLFKKPPTVELHNALNDTILCMKVYFALQARDKEKTNDPVPVHSPRTLSLRIADSSE